MVVQHKVLQIFTSCTILKRSEHKEDSNCALKDVEKVRSFGQEICSKLNRFAKALNQYRLTVQSIVSRLVRTPGKLLSYWEVEEWQRENKYILKWYRPANGSCWTCIRSMIQIHNETGNIWSHFVGLSLMVVLYTRFLFTEQEFLNECVERTIISLYFFSSFLCFGLSTRYHTLSCHSKEVHEAAIRADYGGICVLVFGAFLPLLYYAARNNPIYILVNFTATAVHGLAFAILSQNDVYDTEEYRLIRIGSLVLYSASAVAPAVKMGLEFWCYEEFVNARLGYICVTAACHLVGLIMYAARIPERFYPGKFDLIGQSHQIMHCSVVLGALFNLWGIYGLKEHNLMVETCYN